MIVVNYTSEVKILEYISPYFDFLLDLKIDVLLNQKFLIHNRYL